MDFPFFPRKEKNNILSFWEPSDFCLFTWEFEFPFSKYTLPENIIPTNSLLEVGIMFQS